MPSLRVLTFTKRARTRFDSKRNHDDSKRTHVDSVHQQVLDVASESLTKTETIKYQEISDSVFFLVSDLLVGRIAMPRQARGEVIDPAEVQVVH